MMGTDGEITDAEIDKLNTSTSFLHLRNEKDYERRAFIRAASVQLMAARMMSNDLVEDDVEIVIGAAIQLWDALEAEVP